MTRCCISTRCRPDSRPRSFNPFSLVGRATTLAAGVKEADAFNRDELRVLEIPAGNGTGTARSVAKLYGSAATGGSELGLSRRRPRGTGGPRGATDDGSARQGDTLRHVVLARARQAYVHICVRLVGPGLRMARSRWFVRIRRSGDRRRIRICDEQDALSHVGRPATRRPATSLFRDVLGARVQA